MNIEQIKIEYINFFNTLEPELRFSELEIQVFFTKIVNQFDPLKVHPSQDLNNALLFYLKRRTCFIYLEVLHNLYKNNEIPKNLLMKFRKIYNNC